MESQACRGGSGIGIRTSMEARCVASVITGSKPGTARSTGDTGAMTMGGASQISTGDSLTSTSASTMFSGMPNALPGSSQGVQDTAEPLIGDTLLQYAATPPVCESRRKVRGRAAPR